MDSSDDLKYGDRLVKVWTDKMDATFKKYVDGDQPVGELTDTSEILAICLGMGLAEFKLVDNGFGGPNLKLETTTPVSIVWTGEKFNVYQKQKGEE